MAIPLFLLPIHQIPQNTEYGGNASVTVEHDCDRHENGKCTESGKRRVINAVAYCNNKTEAGAKSDLLNKLESSMRRSDVMVSSVTYDISSCED